MFGIIAISLSILVILAGLAMLAKSKKEGLGNMFLLSSYAAVIGGVCLLLGGLIGGVCMLGKCCNKGASACHSQSYSGGNCDKAAGCSHAGCSKMCNHGAEGKMGKCSMKKHKMMKHHGDQDENIEIEVNIDEDEEKKGEE